MDRYYLGSIILDAQLQLSAEYQMKDIISVGLRTKTGKWFVYLHQEGLFIKFVEFLVDEQSEPQQKSTILSNSIDKFATISLDTGNTSAKNMASYKGIHLYTDGILAPHSSFTPNRNLVCLYGWEHEGLIEKLVLKVS
jgi:hypothetical protein